MKRPILAPSHSQFEFYHKLCWSAKAQCIDKENLLHWIAACWDAQEKAIEEDDRRRAAHNTRESP